MKNFLLMVFSLLIVSVDSAPLYAQDRHNKKSSNSINSVTVPKGPFKFYGQILNPYFDYYEKPGEEGYEFIKNNNAYTWEDIRHHIPQIFPNYHTEELSASELCDMMIRVDNLYLNDREIMARGLVSYIQPHFPQYMQELEFMDELDRLLFSKDPEVLKEFIKYLNGNVEKAVAAKEFTLKSWAVSILRDAAIHNCPARAKAKRYVAYVGPYPTENENGDIVWMDGTVIWQQNN